MPAINLQHVVSVSSEDKNFPAENLIKGDSFKKWKCVAGEKNATVTLQFEKATEINQIDIGNEGSAFVEVLVGKSSASDDSYQVILVSSSFMNPGESRSSQNLNRVRIFGSDALSKAVAGQKWDRVKVVCTQPFNKNTQFGLSFIKLYSPPSVNDKTENVLSKQLTLGAFVVKSDETSDPIKAGSLFERSKQEVAEPPLTGAAAIRAASKTMAKPASDVAPPVGGAENKASKSSEDSSAVAKVKPVEKRASAEQTDEEAKTKAKRKPEAESSRKSPPAKRSRAEASAAASSSSSADSPFSQLMSKVVFVLSGFQNPLRGQLRDKAQEMGATYKGDWGIGCTHLICAFENTPKYNEIKGKGRIVKKEWVVDCYKQKKLLPWRQYRLGRAPSPRASDSEEEDVSARRGKNGKQTEARTKAGAPSKGDVPKLQANKKSEESNEGKRETKGKERNGERKTFHQMSYEGDTDSLSDFNPVDESRSKGKAPMAKTVCIASTSAKKDDEDIYNASTDEEMVANEDNKSDDEFPELPDFFGGKSFFLYGSFSPEDRRLLVRYITAYNGLIIDYMDDTIDFVITDMPWDENFDQALSENDSLSFVKSSWIHACHDAQRMMPHQKFVVTAM